MSGTNRSSERLHRRSRMTGDCHVRFWERPGVKLPGATRLRVRSRIIESGFVEFLMERLRVFPIFDARNELQR